MLKNPIYEGVKWVWLDLDDTLYDFHQSSAIALAGVFEAWNLDRWFASVEQWSDIYHRHNKRLWEDYARGAVGQMELRMQRFVLPLTEVGCPPAQAEALARDMDMDYLDRLAKTGLLLPGAKQLLSALRAAVMKIGILSNGFRDVQYKKLHSAGIADMVDCVVLSDEAGANKPMKAIFDYALRISGATAQNSLMIGDNPDTDIAGATAAGWRAILFTPATDSLLSFLPELGPPVSEL